MCTDYTPINRDQRVKEKLCAKRQPAQFLSLKGRGLTGTSTVADAVSAVLPSALLPQAGRVMALSMVQTSKNVFIKCLQNH